MGKAKNKKNLTKLAKNIRALRIYYRETQEQLAEILHVSQSQIGQYETGDRVPTAENLKDLANHFEVTVFELENEDYEDLGKADEKVILNLINNIDILFPIVYTDSALNNKLFNQAYQEHKSIYNELKTINHLVSFANIFDDILYAIKNVNIIYHKALDDKSILSETVGNIIACLHYELFFLKMIQIAGNRTDYRATLITRAKRIMPEYEIIGVDTDDFSYDKREELNSHNNGLTKEILKLRKILKTKYPDLVNYYLAQQFLLNYVDNNLNRFVNRRIGNEMMSAFRSVGNKYATNYCEL